MPDFSMADTCCRQLLCQASPLPAEKYRARATGLRALHAILSGSKSVHPLGCKSYQSPLPPHTARLSLSGNILPEETGTFARAAWLSNSSRWDTGQLRALSSFLRVYLF